MPGVVAIERVWTIAEADEQIEIAVTVNVHERRLAHRPGGHHQSRRRRLVDERPSVVAVEAQHRTGRTWREAEKQVGVAVGVDIGPRRRARGTRVGHARGFGHVHERALVVAIQPVGLPVEAHEEIEVAVAVIVGKPVHERAARAEQVGLNRGERRRLGSVKA